MLGEITVNYSILCSIEWNIFIVSHYFCIVFQWACSSGFWHCLFWMNECMLDQNKVLSQLPNISTGLSNGSASLMPWNAVQEAHFFYKHCTTIQVVVHSLYLCFTYVAKRPVVYVSLREESDTLFQGEQKRLMTGNSMWCVAQVVFS